MEPYFLNLIINIILLQASFSHQRHLMVVQWQKSSQVFRTLLGILTLLNNHLVWMVTVPIIILIIYSLEFSHQRKLMVFHWRLSDSKSPQVSRTLLSILAVFNNAVVWMVSTRSPTSKSSRPFNNPLVTVPKAPITIGIIVTFMFHSFFNSLARSRYLSLFSHSFSFILWSAGTARSTILQILFFFSWLL